MADDLVFVIDGSDYVCPEITTFTMQERHVMFDLSGIVEEDFVQQDDETLDEKDIRVRKLTRHPGFMEALMHVAYARGNPDLKRAKVQTVIDQTNYMEALEKWAETEADDDSPPASEPTSEPSRSSLRNSVGSNNTSGQDSPTILGLQDGLRNPIGASR